MGLLDAFNSDEGRFGLSLLAAAAPSMEPMNLAGRMGMVSKDLQAQQDNALKAQLTKAQLANYTSEIDARKLAAIKDARQQALIQSVFGGGLLGGTSPGAFAPSADGMGPTMPPTMKTQDTSVLGNLTPDKVAQLKLAGLDLTDIYKFSQEPQKLEGGSTYVNRNTGKREYVAKVGEGIAPDEYGFYNPLKGYPQATAAIKGAEQDATEISKARLDPLGLDYVDTKTGRPIGGSRLDYLRPPQAGTAPSNSTPAPVAPPTRISSNPLAPQPGDSDQGEIFAREIKKAKVALAMATTPVEKMRAQANVDGITREISRLPKAAAQVANSGAGGLQLQSAAEKATAVDQAKADVQPTQARQAGIDGALNAYNLVNKALAHPGLSAATGLQGKLDPSNYIPGTDAKNYDAIAKQLQGTAFLSAFATLKGGGQITEVEGAKAEAAIARLQQSQSTDEYKSALKDYQGVIKQGLTRMGVDPSSYGGASGTWDDKSKSKVIDSLPTPNGSNRGQRIRDTATGKILVSNGLQWRAE